MYSEIFFFPLLFCLCVLPRCYMQACQSWVESKTWNMCTITFVHKTQIWKPRAILPSKASCECIRVHLCVHTHFTYEMNLGSTVIGMKLSFLELACYFFPEREKKTMWMSNARPWWSVCSMLLSAYQTLYLTHYSIRGHRKEQGLA